MRHAIAQPHPVKQCLRTLPGLGTRHPGHTRPEESDVLQSRQVCHQVVRLKDDPDVAVPELGKA